MSTDESVPRARVEELAEAECLQLLGTKQVGRVAYSDPDGPVVMPVNYVLQDDEEARTGWSVLVRGHAARANSWELPDADSRPTPWAAGGRNLHVRLSPHHISGVRLVGQ
jgi:uncharacterized protein